MKSLYRELLKTDCEEKSAPYCKIFFTDKSFEHNERPVMRKHTGVCVESATANAALTSTAATTTRTHMLKAKTIGSSISR